MTDWTNIYIEYKGKWVALDNDEATVIASGDSAQEVWSEAKALVDKPILLEIPEQMINYVGNANFKL
jgi:hypothetical protein